MHILSVDLHDPNSPTGSRPSVEGVITGAYQSVEACQRHFYNWFAESNANMTVGFQGHSTTDQNKWRLCYGRWHDYALSNSSWEEKGVATQGTLHVNVGELKSVLQILIVPA